MATTTKANGRTQIDPAIATALTPDSLHRYDASRPALLSDEERLARQAARPQPAPVTEAETSVALPGMTSRELPEEVFAPEFLAGPLSVAFIAQVNNDFGFRGLRNPLKGAPSTARCFWGGDENALTVFYTRKDGTEVESATKITYAQLGVIFGTARHQQPIAFTRGQTREYQGRKIGTGFTFLADVSGVEGMPDGTYRFGMPSDLYDGLAGQFQLNPVHEAKGLTAAIGGYPQNMWEARWVSAQATWIRTRIGANRQADPAIKERTRSNGLARVRSLLQVRGVITNDVLCATMLDRVGRAGLDQYLGYIELEAKADARLAKAGTPYGSARGTGAAQEAAGELAPEQVPDL